MGSVLSVYVVHQGKRRSGDCRLLEADKLVMRLRDRLERLNSTGIIPHRY
jgi:hypothetical protein